MRIAAGLNRRLLVAFALLYFAPGCLNLGGRTTHVHDNPDTANRISALESRVSALEQVITRSASIEVPEHVP